MTEVDLRRVHEVHLQQASLQRTLRGPVVLQGVQQEGRALLNQVVLHEHVHDLHAEERRNKNGTSVNEFRRGSDEVPLRFRMQAVQSPG